MEIIKNKNEFRKRPTDTKLMRKILDRADLIRKYDVYAFDYIEYPHKSFWQKNFSDDDFRAQLIQYHIENPSEPVMLYVHIPFCEKLCYFCPFAH